MSGAVLDAGALIALERGNRSVATLIGELLEADDTFVVPAGVVAQVWRDGSRQVRLARLLGSDRCDVVPLNDVAARAVGQLLGATATSDVVDASVVLVALAYELPVVTSDADDLLRLDPTIELIEI